MKRVTGGSVANFLRENIVCRFGVPSKIISNNGTPFLNKDVRRLIEWYSISHTTSTSYYPKENGQADAFNKRLLKMEMDGKRSLLQLCGLIEQPNHKLQELHPFL